MLIYTISSSSGITNRVYDMMLTKLLPPVPPITNKENSKCFLSGKLYIKVR